MAVAIEVTDLSKQFRLYNEKYTSLKERVVHGGRMPYEPFWALRDVSVEINAGTTFGILGRNGSGKSTLLKCIAGILKPTSGEVRVRGNLAAMLELGAGMQQELSGRDNIYMNGSLLGLSHAEIERRFDSIVAFAELEQFIDNQVKYYSSGMYVRLGFAVAVNVEPDVLLVDEVLAVGDAAFQRKCLDYVKRFQQEGRTIVVVSHSTDVIRQNCERVMVINHGRVISVDEPGEGIRVFLADLLGVGMNEGFETEVPQGTNVLVIGTVQVEHGGSGSAAPPLPGRVPDRHGRARQPRPGAQRRGFHRHLRRQERVGLLLGSRRPGLPDGRAHRGRVHALRLCRSPPARWHLCGERGHPEPDRCGRLRLEGPGHPVRGGQSRTVDRPGAPAPRGQLPAPLGGQHRGGPRRALPRDTGREPDRLMAPRRIDQVIPSLASRDAIGGHVVQLRDLLRTRGFQSDIYYGNATADRLDFGYPVDRLGDRSSSDRVLLYQLSIGSGVGDIFRDRSERKFVNYHNITPADLLEPWIPAVGEEVRWGRAQLDALAPVTEFAVADSRFNEQELIDAGYPSTTTVPLLIDLEGFAGEPDPVLAARLGAEQADGGTSLLFVGKVSPHKAQHDLVKALAAYRQLYDRKARLRLVGGAISEDYRVAVERFADELGLLDAVEIAGSVTHEELIAYYAATDVFVCLSNHEGFCVPLLEAMYHRVPIVAHTSTAVPETVDGAGLVLPEKSPALVAAAINRVATDDCLRAALAQRASERVASFSLERVRASFAIALESAYAA